MDELKEQIFQDITLSDNLNENIKSINHITKELEKNNIGVTFDEYDSLIKAHKVLSEIISNILNSTDKNELKHLTLSSKELIDVYKITNNIETLDEEGKNIEDKNTKREEVSINDNYDGDRIFMQQITAHKVLSKEEELKLTQEYYKTKDKKIKDKLVESNLKFIISIARRYTGLQIPLKDLVQEGVIGLMRSIDLFDPNRGYRLNTYSGWYIRQSISRAVANTMRNIRIPIGYQQELLDYNHTKKQLEKELGENPTEEQLAKKLDLPIQKIREFESYSNDTVSLNKRIGADSEEEIGDFIADLAPTPEEKIITEYEKEYLSSLLKHLSKRDQIIIILFFGLFGEQKRTLEGIAKVLYDNGLTKDVLTRERIRQRKESAYARLMKIAKYGVNNQNSKTNKVKKEETNELSLYDYYIDKGYTLDDIAYFITRYNDKELHTLKHYFREDLKGKIIVANTVNRKKITNILDKPLLEEEKKEHEFFDKKTNELIDNKMKEQKNNTSLIPNNQYYDFVDQIVYYNTPINNIIKNYHLNLQETEILYLKLCKYYCNTGNYEKALHLIDNMEDLNLISEENKNNVLELKIKIKKRKI